MSVSLDGYIAGPDGAIDWSAPDEELLRFKLDQTRELTRHLSGRGLYEDMLVWETADRRSPTPGTRIRPVWTALPQVVFQPSLTTVKRTPAWPAQTSRPRSPRLKDQPGDGRVGVGGAGLPPSLAEKDLIDEYRLFTCPVVLGGGTPYFPPCRSD